LALWSESDSQQQFIRFQRRSTISSTGRGTPFFDWIGTTMWLPIGRPEGMAIASRHPEGENRVGTPRAAFDEPERSRIAVDRSRYKRPRLPSRRQFSTSVKSRPRQQPPTAAHGFCRIDPATSVAGQRQPSRPGRPQCPRWRKIQRRLFLHRRPPVRSQENGLPKNSCPLEIEMLEQNKVVCRTKKQEARGRKPTSRGIRIGEPLGRASIRAKPA